MSGLVDFVRLYHAACDSGDDERIAACFTSQAVHYYQRMAPQHGAAQIGAHFGSQAREIDGR